jgi:hypothetical protein
MKVHELIAALQNVDANAEVILQKDAEGNGYLPLCGVDDDIVYDAENREVYVLSQGPDDADKTEEEWEELKNQGKSVVLFPI